MAPDSRRMDRHPGELERVMAAVVERAQWSSFERTGCSVPEQEVSESSSHRHGNDFAVVE